MEKNNCQKIKLLKLSELLRQESDEQHPLTTMTIVERLKDMGISCDRRTLTSDIATLNEHGIEVMWKWVKKQKGYYVEDRSFSIPEIKILIDAVQAASFITEKKTIELTDKLADLGGSHRAEILKSNLICFNTRKHSNEGIYYNIDALIQALQDKQKVIFRYYDLGLAGERVYRRNRHHYVVEPVALVFNDDNYYLVAYSAKHDNTTNYRIDRMDSVEAVEDEISEKAISLRSTIGTYTEQAVYMYAGLPEDISLKFDRKLVGAVFDRFGEKTTIQEENADLCTTSVRVQLSPTFWGWLFQFAGKMQIISPDSAVSEYEKYISAAKQE